MYKIAAVGDYDSIYGFSALGFSVFPVSDGVEGAAVLKRLSEEGYGIVYITEAAAAQAGEELEKYHEDIFMSVVLIPGISGNTGEGAAQVRKFVERAVGSDIL